VLVMLEQELNRGAKWPDLAEIMGQTVTRITALLNGLQAESNTPPDTESLTPTGLITQLIEVFGPLAARKGIMIEASTACGPDQPIADIFGRVFIALSKLLHNAISHSDGSTIRLEVVAGRGKGDEAIMTWHVLDDGIGLPEVIHDRLHKPRAIGQICTGAGSGLFTAAQAMGSLGGDLRLIDSQKGCHFVLIHPLRGTASETPPAAQTASRTKTSFARHRRGF